MDFKRLFLDTFFPNSCLICHREGTILCDDCFSLIDINPYLFCHVCGKRITEFKVCEKCRRKTNLSALFFATHYQDKVVQKIIKEFKYPPFLKELAKPLSSLIISHLSLLEFSFPENSILIPVPLSKRREKWRGFNQAKEIAKYLSFYYSLPLEDGVVKRVKETFPQSNLSQKERKENIKGSFTLLDREKIKGKNIFLVDDVCTTGSTLEEVARVLKEGKPKNIFGMVVAKE